MSSSIFLRSTARRAAFVPRGVITAPRYSSTRLYSSTMHDNDPDTLEKEKHKNLQDKQHKTSAPHGHAPGWNEYLASASEAAIKADKADGVTPEIMQKKSVEHIRARHHADDATVGVKAEYERDVVEGPLSKVKEVMKEVKEMTGGKS